MDHTESLTVVKEIIRQCTSYYKVRTGENAYVAGETAIFLTIFL
jgi:hypothetical protein